MQHPVLIFGAGLGGLSVAQGLLKNNIPFRIYERDAGLNVRIQGYRVRVAHEGVIALQNNLSAEKFEKFKSTSGWVSDDEAGTKILGLLDAYTTELDVESPKKWISVSSGPPFAVDRVVLRSILLEGLDQYITWNCGYSSIEELSDGVIVTLSNGDKARGSVFVAADGVWSKARQHLMPDYQLLNLGARLIYGKTELKGSFPSQFCDKALTIGGITIISDEKNKLKLLQEPMHFKKEEPYVPSDYVYWGLFVPPDNNAGNDRTHLDTAGVRELVKSLTSEWDPSLGCLFDTDFLSLHHAVSSPPVIPSWRPETYITLIGDAIHPMAPTAAFGATSALMDAGAVVSELVKVRDAGEFATAGAIPKALRAYEKEMRVYAAHALHSSALNGKLMFAMKPWDELEKVKMH